MITSMETTLIFALIEMFIGAILGIGLVYAILNYMNNKPKAYILQERNNTLFLYKTVNIKLSQHDFKLGNSTYFIDFTKSSYLKGSKPVLFYIKDNASPINFSEGSKIDAVKLKQYVDNKTIINLFKALNPNTNNTSMYVMVGLGAVMGFLAGLVLAPYIVHGITVSSTNSTAKKSPPVIPVAIINMFKIMAMREVYVI